MRKIDATQGNLVKLIFVYTIPLIFTTIIQHLFTIADTAVLGNMADTVSVAAVGATSTITTLMINCFTGLSSGTSIVLARFIGQKDEDKIKMTVDTSLITGFCFGVLVAVVGVIFAPAFLTLTGCPAECYEGAVLYIRIYIAAAPATLLYNYGSAILRVMGDTQRPLIYITVSGAINLVLNVVLCIIFPQKYAVAAVAIATAVSKIVSAVLVVARLCHLEDKTRLSIAKMRFKFESFVNIIKFGVPTSVSNLITPLSNLQIITAVNSFGVDAVAGSGAAAQLINLAYAFTGGFAVATTTFMGQNIGAKNHSRVKRSFWSFLLISTLISGIVGLLLYCFCEVLLGIVVGTSAVTAISYGKIRMFYMAQFVFLNAIINVISHAMMAYGYPLFSSVKSIIFTLGFRVIWMQILYPQNPTFDMIFMCFTVSWTLDMIFGAIVITIFNRRYSKGKYKKI